MRDLDSVFRSEGNLKVSSLTKSIRKKAVLNFLEKKHFLASIRCKMFMNLGFFNMHLRGWEMGSTFNWHLIPGRAEATTSTSDRREMASNMVVFFYFGLLAVLL